MGNALGMAQQGGQGGVAVGLLTALAEHADDAERSRRQTLTAALTPRLPEVCVRMGKWLCWVRDTCST